jgi:tetratricopeptide (TPR) repeat protein
VEAGEEAVTSLSAIGRSTRDSYELTKAWVRTATYLEALSYFIPDPNEQKKTREKAEGYWLKAKELSVETAFLEFFHSYCFQVQLLGWEPGTDGAISNLEIALEYGRKTKDKLVTGGSLDWLAYHNSWKSNATEDEDERRALLEAALKCATDAKEQYSHVLFKSPRDGLLWVEAPEPEYYTKLSSFETELEKRRILLEKALKAAALYKERAENSGYPDIIFLAYHILSNIFSFLADVEENSEQKTNLLRKALEHRNLSISIGDKIVPCGFLWNQGMILSGLSRIKSKLAELSKDPETRKRTLQEAVLDKEKSLKLCMKDMQSYEKRGASARYSVLGTLQYEHGRLLNRLYRLTNDPEQLIKAIESFQEAAETCKNLDLVSRIAECHWRIAQAYDSLGEHIRAAENFDLASNHYIRAADKIHQLKDFYQNHALYMRAWSEIEKARHHHRRQEYGIAKEHFEKAATIHKSLKQWSYMAPNYAAWAEVEYAEELSREEKSEEALNGFKQAATLFNQTKDTFRSELSKTESKDETEMITDLLRATELRHEYCVARVVLEQAKILDKKGDHYASSEKYGEVAKSLESMIAGLESEQDEKEINYLLHLSRAWQKMTQADAQQSPELYLEASQLFEKAKEVSPNEKTNLLTLGHSRFCKALEAGTRFTDTREAGLHAAALQHLESAADYYSKAGFDHASEYAKATRLLFDAYVRMDNAVRENDFQKKTKLYMIVEKLLQTSAGSYMKAEHPEKREQVLRLLERAREEKELAASLAEVLYAPIITSTTSFPSPTPTSEKAVGLEKLEHAQIQANVICSRKELTVGDSFNLEIELANAGKGIASLVKITGAVPESFKIIEKPETCRLELNDLNMRGKRLNPLKTEEVKLTLKPIRQGTFYIKPTIFYIDEEGKNKSHEPEAIAVTVVRELGIKGWLKGER